MGQGAGLQAYLPSPRTLWNTVYKTLKREEGEDKEGGGAPIQIKTLARKFEGN